MCWLHFQGLWNAGAYLPKYGTMHHITEDNNIYRHQPWEPQMSYNEGTFKIHMKFDSVNIRYIIQAKVIIFITLQLQILCHVNWKKPSNKSKQNFQQQDYDNNSKMPVEIWNEKYVVGSKSFWPDIQKPHQMENAVGDI